MSKNLRLATVTLGVLIFHFAVTAWALHNASGAVLVGDSTYETEFLDYPTLLLALLSVVALVMVAAKLPLWGLVLTAGLTAVSVWGATVEMDRWTASGFAQGLEILAFGVPVLILLIGLFACGVSALVGWTSRRSPPTSTAP